MSPKLGGKVNQVTIYRSLDALYKAQIVKRVNLEHDHAHFELAVGREHHHHAVCRDCGYIENIEIPHAPKPEKEAMKRTRGFSFLDTYSLEFFGLCKNVLSEKDPRLWGAGLSRERVGNQAARAWLPFSCRRYETWLATEAATSNDRWGSIRRMAHMRRYDSISRGPMSRSREVHSGLENVGTRITFVPAASATERMKFTSWYAAEPRISASKSSEMHPQSQTSRNCRPSLLASTSFSRSILRSASAMDSKTVWNAAISSVWTLSSVSRSSAENGIIDQGYMPRSLCFARCAISRTAISTAG